MPGDYQTNGLFGDQPNNSRISATMLNADAPSDADFGYVLANGIKGAAMGAMYGMVRNAQDSGQIASNGASASGVTVSASSNAVNLLLVGGLLYLAFAG